MARYILITIALIASLASVGIADVKLPAVLSDNMVLQQGKRTTIWGTADHGEKVSITLGAAQADTVADDKGNWQVAFEPLIASDKPIDMTVAGKNTLKVSNILVGEVWLCAGQSNMGRTMLQTLNSTQEIAAADFPQLRLMTTPNLETELTQHDLGADAKWSPCSSKTVGSFSAVAYFFGREIHKTLKVPVGLIHASRGGSTIESWIPLDTYKTNPDLAVFLPMFEKHAAGMAAANEKYATDVAQWAVCRQAILATRPTATAPADYPRRPQRPLGTGETYGGLYNTMVAPLTRLNIAGVIWYQGEADASQRRNDSHNHRGYQKELPIMIGAWRKAFNQDFPFLFVQLPNYFQRTNDPNANPLWAEFREAQATVLSVPKTGMAVTIDAGETWGIHPPDKQTVGHRLALAGLGITYGKKDVVYEGPMFDSMKLDGDKLIVTFKHAEGGLVSKGEHGEVSEFAIAGADGKYYWADAGIDGNSVILTSKSVAKPVSVRYAFQSDPKVTLYNKSGLPACPFRAGEKVVERMVEPQDWR